MRLMSTEWWPSRNQPLADMTLRESVRATLLSAPLGFVATSFGVVIKGYVPIGDLREVVLLGLAGSVMVPVIMVFSFGVARLWRWLWRNFPS